ncbi:MAG TPA: DUF2207 domain-containing protein [Candidatus Saccharimonadales bacterium]|jgi:uncharacterized membrane protein|nr:DUF2207 domain-containing protein [Candidatus Saccharimonadales bacterium]
MQTFLKRLRGVRIAALTAFFALVFVCIPVATAHADVNNFVVTNFEADYALTADDPQGEMSVIERIYVHFNDNNHGILRAIPSYYKGHRLQLQVNRIVSGSGAQIGYSTSNSNGNTVLKIGDPKKTVTGDQEYTISYTVRNVIGFYKDHDELYWDINGDQWQQQFQGVSMTLHLPKGLKLSSNEPVCYTGARGNTGSDCRVSTDTIRNNLQVTSIRAFDAGETLTAVIGFQKGYFKAATWQDTLGEYSTMLVQFFVPLAIIGGTAGLYWFKRGRDAKGRGVIVAQFDAPDGLKPIEVGTIIDFKTDNGDITATIIDLAIRGYIKITEQKKERKLLSDTLSYTFRLMKTETKDLASYEEDLLKALFANFQMHEEVSMSFLKYKLSQKVVAIRKLISTSLTGRGYFSNNPFNIYNYYVIGAYVGIGAICFVLAIFHSVVPVWAGAVSGMVIALIFLHFVPARTLKGAHAKEHILGLKLYLKTAEADRIRMLQSPGAPYIVSTLPERTVELFEKLLPYAMVLGVEKDWAKQFEEIYKTAPDWYSGNWTTFNAVYLASSISDNLSASVNTAFGAPSNSGGSGFSGGSAGGGGGGGGGGGW